MAVPTSILDTNIIMHIPPYIEDLDQRLPPSSSKYYFSRQSSIILYPEPTDVILGRSNSIYDHIGNRNFRAIIASHYKQYKALQRSSDKSKLLKEIYGQFTSSGTRFLKALHPKEEASGGYIEVDATAAKGKLSQALRYAAERKNENSLLEQYALRDVVVLPVQCQLQTPLHFPPSTFIDPRQGCKNLNYSVGMQDPLEPVQNIIPFGPSSFATAVKNNVLHTINDMSCCFEPLPLEGESGLQTSTSSIGGCHHLDDNEFNPIIFPP
jgi:hypothetical protein